VRRIDAAISQGAEHPHREGALLGISSGSFKHGEAARVAGNAVQGKLRLKGGGTRVEVVEVNLNPA
jgi:hypothetical protein